MSALGGKRTFRRYGIRTEGGARVPRYAEGQVWEYRTRRGEEHSLVKIQRIEVDPETDAAIFHVSLIGLNWPNGDELAHAPVSQTTLDISVTQLLSTEEVQFPAPDEGIAIWRRANGGVYAVSLAEIVEMGDFDPTL
jgi:hypothetical protein